MAKCPDCSVEFLNKGDLYRHRRGSHGFVTCSCGRQFLKNEFMQQHIKGVRKHVEETGRFECVDCFRRFKRKSKLENHKALKGHDGTESLPTSDVGGDVYLLRSNGIDKFIDDHIQADKQYLRCCGIVIDTLVRHMTDIPGQLQSKRIIKVPQVHI